MTANYGKFLKIRSNGGNGPFRQLRGPGSGREVPTREY